VVKKIKVIRTAAGSSVSWGLIDALRKNGIEVVGVDSKELSFVFHLLKKWYVVPRGDDSNFIDRMLEIIDKEKPDAIISGPETELLALSKNKDRIEKSGTLILCPPYDSVKICADKIKANSTVRNLDIPLPDFYEDFDSVKYPCIIKPRFGRGSVGINIARNEKEFKFYLDNFEDFVVQEFVEGEEYSVDILADQEGNSLSIVPRLRVETDSGVSTKGITVNDEELIGYCRKIVKDLKLFGPSCIQFIRGREGFRFLEINARFGGGSILSIKADPSILQNLIRLIKGEKTIPSNGFKEGVTMMRYYSEIFVDQNG